MKRRTSYGLACFLILITLNSCKGTYAYERKNVIPIYKERTMNGQKLRYDGFYLELGKELYINIKEFIRFHFFNENGITVTYYYHNINIENARKKLLLDIKLNNKENIETWGAYIIKDDELKIQATGYNIKKYNFIVKYSVLEKKLKIDSEKLEYLMYFDVLNRGDTLRTHRYKGYYLIFNKFHEQPNYKALNLD